MHSRAATSEDTAAIKGMKERAHYGFRLPIDADGSIKLLGLHVAEEDGHVIAAAGFEPTVQIYTVLDPDFRSPHRRLETMKMLHGPVAREILKTGAKEIYSFIDPRYRGFDNRMLDMGWDRKLWDCYFIERAEAEKLYGGPECT